MSFIVEPAKISGQKPAVNNCFRSQFRIVEVMRHHRLAVRRNFSHALGIGTQYSKLDSRQRLAHGVRAKGLEVVQRKRSARFRQPISIRNWYPKVIKKLQRRGFHESAAREKSDQLVAERAMHLR